MEKKDISEKDAKRLKEAVTHLAKIPSNSLCADCQQQCTLWASVNIGVFICSRCAGMHRHLGVHITQVRSINLDVWTPSQLVSVLVNGNAWVNSWLMSKPGAPDIGRQRINDSSMSRHIHDKYEKHRFGDATGLLLVSKKTFPNLTVEKALTLFKLAMSLHRKQNDHCSIRLELLKAAEFCGLSSVPQSNPLHKRLILLSDPTMLALAETKKAPTGSIVTVKAQVSALPVAPAAKPKQENIVDLDEFTDFTSSAPVTATNGSTNGTILPDFDPFVSTAVKPHSNGFANFAFADAPAAQKPATNSIIDMDWIGGNTNPIPSAVTSPSTGSNIGNFAVGNGFNAFGNSNNSVKNGADLTFPAFGGNTSPATNKVDPDWPSTSTNSVPANGKPSHTDFDNLFAVKNPAAVVSPVSVPLPTSGLTASNDFFPDLFASAPSTTSNTAFPVASAPLGAHGNVIPQATPMPTVAPIGGGPDDVDFILSLYSK